MYAKIRSVEAINMKQKLLTAIQTYKQLDAKATAMASTVTCSDPMYFAADYVGMVINVYVYRFINWLENKLK